MPGICAPGSEYQFYDRGTTTSQASELGNEYMLSALDDKEHSQDRWMLWYLRITVASRLEVSSQEIFILYLRNVDFMPEDVSYQ